MSDRERFLQALKEAGPKGLHSHDVRRRGISGHPSERAAELERKGYSIRRVRENVGRRPGVRFYLETAGVGAGVPKPQGSGGAAVPDRASVDPGGPTQTQMLEEPVKAPQRPLSAFRDQEAA